MSDFILSAAGRRYIQLWEVISGPGTDKIRENVLESIGQGTLRKSLDERRHIFRRLLRQNKIYDQQFSTLFSPPGGANAEPDYKAIDITLWVIICKTVTVHRRGIDWFRSPSDTDVAWEHDAVRLRDARNHLSHLIQPKITDEDYQQLSGCVKQALRRLGVSMDELTKLFTDDDSYVLSEEAKNYIRLRVLVVEVGTERIRYHILKNINYISLHDAVQAHVDKLVNDISPFQKAVLYPSKNEQNLQKTLETDVDISLWTVVARKLLKPEVVGKFDWKSEPSADQREWFHDVCRVRDVRNYLAHLPRPRVTQEEFIERWVELTGALIRLGGDEKLIRSYLGQDFHGMQPEYITTSQYVLYNVLSCLD
jgi:hypothetical protein